MNPRAVTGISSRHNGERGLLRLRNRSAQSRVCASSLPRRARECSKTAAQFLRYVPDISQSPRTIKCTTFDYRSII